MNNPNLSIKQIFTSSFAIYEKHFFPLFGVSLLIVLLNFPVNWLLSLEDNHLKLVGVLMAPVIFMVSLLFFSVLIVSLDQTTKGESVDLKVSFKQSLGVFWGYLCCSMITGLIIGLGFLLLIIPGLYLTIIFFFAPYFILLDGKQTSAALKESKRIVKGNMAQICKIYGLIILMVMPVLGLTVLIQKVTYGAVACILLLVINVVLASLWPFIAAVFYNLFIQLKKASSN
ncbi:MAG: hypothetical protein HQL13_04055 [Candidatus Omnitrophica bacterium]|nr:hypothetical protein [Candidatus Omnitrophota bacterium]